MLAVPPLTPPQCLIEAYRTHLQQTRGLAPSTVYHHTSTATEFLRFIRHERGPNQLHKLAADALEGFLEHRATRNNRAGLQHVAALAIFLAVPGQSRSGVLRAGGPGRYAADLPRGTSAAFLTVGDGAGVSEGQTLCVVCPVGGPWS
jgi:hypothetical protein